MAENMEAAAITTHAKENPGRRQPRESAVVTPRAGQAKASPRGGAPPLERAPTNRGTARAAQPAGARDLRRDLRDFASARPQGWGHDDWLVFLEGLQTRGHDIRDRDAIGVALEKERLDLRLTKTKGIGPQRRQILIDRYGTVWNLRNAPAEEIASTARIPRALAETLKGELA